MKTILSVVALFVSFSVASVFEPDVIDDIAVLFKTANTKELSKYFAPKVELVIIDDEDVFSKVQAELILKDFFAKHVPVTSKIQHRSTGNPNTYRFGVINLNTKSGLFRITVTLKNTAGKFLITEMRIESYKE